MLLRCGGVEALDVNLNILFRFSDWLGRLSVHFELFFERRAALFLYLSCPLPLKLEESRSEVSLGTLNLLLLLATELLV